eukprot:9488202-Pyramimonas_sp.AAC.2
MMRRLGFFLKLPLLPGRDAASGDWTAGEFLELRANLGQQQFVRQGEGLAAQLDREFVVGQQAHSVP